MSFGCKAMGSWVESAFSVLAEAKKLEAQGNR